MKNLHGIFAAIVMCSLLSTAVAGQVTVTSPRAGAMTMVPDVQPNYTPIPVAKKCCKVCKKSKACGNNCIKRYKMCGKAPGCACNAK